VGRVRADGTAFLSALVFDSTTARSAMVASRSSDGGITWSDPTVLLADNDPDVTNDKESITADPADPGRVYVVWDRLTGLTQPNKPVGTGPAWFARTTDGMWEPARPIFDPGIDAQTIGSVIVVLPDGTLVNAFNLITKGSSTAPVNTLAAIRSTDKGLTWSAPILIAPMNGVGVRDPNNKLGVRSGTILPEIAVDRANGVIYIVWEDVRPGATFDGIALVTSRDGGLSWSAPVMINGATDTSAFTPMVAVAAGGTVGVTYFDLRDANLADASMFRTSAWLALSYDGGGTWHDEPVGESFDLRPAALVDTYFSATTRAGDQRRHVRPFFVGATPDDHDHTDVFVRAVD